MSTLCIAIGNSLRGEDNAAHELVRDWPQSEESAVLHVIQLMPEVAAEFPGHAQVLFVDADSNASQIQTERVEESTSSFAPLSHHFPPAVIVALARKLYAWKGEAYLCRIPARQFDAPAEQILK